jgi:DNA-3-methyladenine glycosylase II
MERDARVESADGQVRRCHAIPVRLPYRLDLTVNVLRRLSTNLVDVLTYDRAYVRILGDLAEPIVVRVKQLNPGTLTVDIKGPARDHERVLALIARMLGVDVDLTQFYDSASAIPWLHPLSLRMRGVKPPRYPTLWEACVNAIVFQQISLAAASAIMGRLIVGLDAAALLQRIKGIGPWTAAVILLRGLGRLDAFPLNDTSVARTWR